MSKCPEELSCDLTVFIEAEDEAEVLRYAMAVRAWQWMAVVVTFGHGPK
jgi:hypothetical protein